MPSTTHRQCPECRHVMPADQYQRHRHDAHGVRRGSPSGWRNIRKQVIERDHGCCVVCSTTDRLEVHHVDGNAQNNALDNLETRCVPHNPRGENASASPYAGRWRGVDMLEQTMRQIDAL